MQYIIYIYIYTYIRSVESLYPQPSGDAFPRWGSGVHHSNGILHAPPMAPWAVFKIPKNPIWLVVLTVLKNIMKVDGKDIMEHKTFLKTPTSHVRKFKFLFNVWKEIDLVGLRDRNHRYNIGNYVSLLYGYKPQMIQWIELNSTRNRGGSP